MWKRNVHYRFYDITSNARLVGEIVTRILIARFSSREGLMSSVEIRFIFYCVCPNEGRVDLILNPTPNI